MPTGSVFWADKSRQLRRNAASFSAIGSSSVEHEDLVENAVIEVDDRNGRICRNEFIRRTATPVAGTAKIFNRRFLVP